MSRFSGRVKLVLALLILATGTTLRAASLLELRELPELVQESSRALRAEVLDVRHAYDERRLPSTFVTLRVEESLYGSELPAPGGELTIKLFGSPVAMPNGLRLFVDGTPLYRKGERYLLLLTEQSKWGFTNTAGLYQGAMRIDRSDDSAPALSSEVLSLWREFGRATWSDERPADGTREGVDRSR